MANFSITHGSNGSRVDTPKFWNGKFLFRAFRGKNMLLSWLNNHDLARADSSSGAGVSAWRRLPNVLREFLDAGPPLDCTWIFLITHNYILYYIFPLTTITYYYVLYFYTVNISLGVRFEKPSLWIIAFKYFRQFREKQWPGNFCDFCSEVLQ